MEEQAKQEMLSKLYTLRAGISAVSVEKDKADEVMAGYQSQLKEVQNQIDGGRATLVENKSLIEQSNRGKLEIQESLSKAQDEMGAKNLQDIDRRIEKLKSESWLHYAIWERSKKKRIMYIILAVIAGIASFVIASGLIIDSWILYPLFMGGLLVTIVSIILARRCGTKINEERKKWGAADEKIKQLEDSKSAMEIAHYTLAATDEVNAELEQAIAEREEMILQLENQKETLMAEAKEDEKIIFHTEMSNVLYQGLEKEFKAFLDTRDWENVDYMIYLIETGRADNVKEALQLVDRERNMDRLISAVNNATSVICNTLTDGMRRLGTLVTRCCAELSQQVNAVGLNLQMQTEQLSDRFQGLNNYVSNLTSQVELGNALQAKANETSIKLMRDVQVIREHSDYADWRLRNPDYKY